MCRVWLVSGCHVEVAWYPNSRLGFAWDVLCAVVIEYCWIVGHEQQWQGHPGCLLQGVLFPRLFGVEVDHVLRLAEGHCSSAFGYCLSSWHFQCHLGRPQYHLVLALCGCHCHSHFSHSHFYFPYYHPVTGQCCVRFQLIVTTTLERWCVCGRASPRT